MRIYLAHPVTLYGTDEQARAIELLERDGYKVVNPGNLEHQDGYRVRGMDYFTDLVRTCGVLAFLRFPNGRIGAGVGKEIDAAKSAGLRILALAGDEWRDVSALDLGPYLSVGETRALIAEIRKVDPMTTPPRDPAALADALDPRKIDDCDDLDDFSPHYSTPTHVLIAASDLLRTLSTPTESHRLAAEEIVGYFNTVIREKHPIPERQLTNDVAALLARDLASSAPLPLSGDEQKAAPNLIEAMKGIVHFGDAVAYRQDTLSVALRQWIDAGRAALTELEK